MRGEQLANADAVADTDKRARHLVAELIDYKKEVTGMVEPGRWSWGRVRCVSCYEEVNVEG